MIEKLKKLPPVSTLTTAFGITACASMAVPGSGLAMMVGMPVALLSPIGCGGMAAIGTFGAFNKSESKLSRAFSTAAAATGWVSLITFATLLGQSGPDGLAGFLISVPGMAASGALNIAASLTEKKGNEPKVPPQDNPPTPK